MRGKLTGLERAAVEDGITPAHAGKTVAKELIKEFGWDHPRACGENCTSADFSVVRSGSPPRMRGKRRRAGRDCLQSGITPAHAGKTHVPHIDTDPR